MQWPIIIGAAGLVFILLWLVPKKLRSRKMRNRKVAFKRRMKR